MYGNVLQGRAMIVWKCSTRYGYKCMELFYKGKLYMYWNVLQGMAINVWDCSTRESYTCIGMFYKG